MEFLMKRMMELEALGIYRRNRMELEKQVVPGHWSENLAFYFPWLYPMFIFWPCCFWTNLVRLPKTLTVKRDRIDFHQECCCQTSELLFDQISSIEVYQANTATCLSSYCLCCACDGSEWLPSSHFTNSLTATGFYFKFVSNDLGTSH
jgi:hypothetical protein